MRIVCAPDSFKESMTAAAAAEAMARGIAGVDPTIECVLVPMADGGEGTTEALVAALTGELIEVECHDALGRATTGRIGWISEKSLAVVEVAAAIGLERIDPADRDPWRATSRGAGELIRAALGLGARDLIVGLGGSATNDGGAGMLMALGARCRDMSGAPLHDGAAALLALADVDLAGLDPRLARARIRVASDVTNPLLGETGASAVFGPQKGASTEDVTGLDEALTRWADVVEAATGRAVRDQPGAGAAGGLGAAFLGATEASMQGGVGLVIEVVGLREALNGANWVFTGEGRIDQQTALGKTPVGVARAAHAAGVPAVIFGGDVPPQADDLVGPEVLAVVPIVSGPSDLPSALADGAVNLARSVATITRVLLAAAAKG